jgi:hypothetical protein
MRDVRTHDWQRLKNLLGETVSHAITAGATQGTPDQPPSQDAATVTDDRRRVANLSVRSYRTRALVIPSLQRRGCALRSTTGDGGRGDGAGGW